MDREQFEQRRRERGIEYWAIGDRMGGYIYDVYPHEVTRELREFRRVHGPWTKLLGRFPDPDEATACVRRHATERTRILNAAQRRGRIPKYALAEYLQAHPSRGS